MTDIMTNNTDALREAVLRAALKPFAAAADVRLCGEWGDHEHFGRTDIQHHLTFGDLRRAKEAYQTSLTRAALSHSHPQQAMDREAVENFITPEWCINMAHLEGDAEIGAGLLALEMNGEYAAKARELLAATYEGDDLAYARNAILTHPLGEFGPWIHHALRAIEAALALSPPALDAEAPEACEKCDDSGWIETTGGGIWTGEGVTTRRTPCDCICGQDVQREQAAAALTNLPTGSTEGLKVALVVCEMVVKASLFETRQSKGESLIGWQKGDGADALTIRNLARAALANSTEAGLSEAGLVGLERDFRQRANQCRHNLDGYDLTAAAVWDFAADAVRDAKC